MDGINYFDGGAFAELGFRQYPCGMGLQPLPLNVTRMQQQPQQVDHAPSYLTASVAGSRHEVGGTRETNEFSKQRAAAATVKEVVSAGALVVGERWKDSRAGAGCEESAAETAARTRAALHKAIVDGTSRREAPGTAVEVGSSTVRRLPPLSSTALVVTAAGAGLQTDPGPIARSPTKEKKTAAFAAGTSSSFKSALRVRRGTAAEDDSGGEERESPEELPVGKDGSVVVPFCVSNWRNKKKLIIPVAQRQAQGANRGADTAPIGQGIVDLAMAMQAASREVTAELEAKERAAAEAQERRQQTLEAEEAERATKLLEANAARAVAADQRRETREQRLERIRLERELREREKAAKQQQRVRERAAARLNISVEALEADEELLKAAEETAASVPLTGRSGSGSGMVYDGVVAGQASGVGSSIFMDEMEAETQGVARRPRVRGGVFGGAVISNEGIAQQMVLMAERERQGGGSAVDQQAGGGTDQHYHDGIRLHEESRGKRGGEDDEGESSSDEEQDSETVAKLLAKKRRRL